MTVIRRRTPVEPPSRRKSGRRAPLQQRFPVGRRVQVYEDFHDVRYAGRIGTVMAVVGPGDDPHYAKGRVAVRLVIDELYVNLFGRQPESKQPNPVWFRPTDLDRSPDA